jgi:hypothetical protein
VYLTLFIESALWIGSQTQTLSRNELSSKRMNNVGVRLYHTSWCLDMEEVGVIARLTTKLGLRQRKALLTICRVQADGRWNPQIKRLSKDIIDSFPDLGIIPSDFGVRTYQELAASTRNLITFIIKSPWISGLTSMLITGLPGVSVDEGNQALEDSMYKELYATQSLDRPPQISYGAVFYDGEIPFFGDSLIGPRPDTNWEAVGMLDWFRNSVREKLYLPAYSTTKSMSRDTALRYWAKVYPHIEDITGWKNVCSRDLLEWYMHTGEQLGGMAEMRQIFKFNDTKPRSYFSQGGDLFWPSTHFQEFFSALCDIFPSTNRFQRFSIIDFYDISPEDLVLIYDFTSFTSNMAEQKYFLERLADFFEGVEIRVFDVRKGIILVNAGEQIRQYNLQANCLPEFSMERLLEGEHIFRHLVAGFLGVFGNITSCTFLHGLGLSQVTIDRVRSRCVGDDALGQIERLGDSTIEIVDSAIGIMGSYERSKMVVWEKDGDESTQWHFCKRPINRSDRKITSGHLFQFPSIHLWDQLDDGFHVKKPTLGHRQKLFATQTRRLLDQVIMWAPEDYDEEVIRHYLKAGYKRLGLPLEGHVPRSSKSDFGYVIAPVDRDLREMSWDIALLSSARGSFVTIPYTVEVEEKVRFDLGESFNHHGNPGLRLASDMGFYMKEGPLLTTVLLDGAIYDWYLRFLKNDGSIRMLYKYTVIMPLLPHFRSLCTAFQSS